MKLPRLHKRKITPLSFIFFLILFFIWKFDPSFFKTLSDFANGPAQSGRIAKVIDGDTLVLEGGERIRLIGVDTPETVHPEKPVEYFGKEASSFTRRMAEGKPVRLEFDQQKKDKYGRSLAYVYLEDGTFLNAEIIKQGYGFAYVYFPFTKMEEFKNYQATAEKQGTGLWGKCEVETNQSGQSSTQ